MPNLKTMRASDSIRRIFFLTTCVVALVTPGCGGQTGGFPSGLGDGLVEDATRTLAIHVRWEAVAGSDAAANGRDQVSSDAILGPKRERLKAPAGARDAWVTLQGVGIDGSNVAFYMTSDATYFGPSGPDASYSQIEQSARTRRWTTSNVPGIISGAEPTGAADLRNILYAYTVPVFRSGEVTAIVEFFDRKPDGTPYSYGERLTASPDRRKGVSTFVSKFPASPQFSLLKGVAATQDLSPRGRLVVAEIDVTGLPSAAQLGQSVSVQATESTVNGPRFFATVPKSASTNPTKLELLLVDRSQSFNLRARVHSGKAATGIVLKHGDATNITYAATESRKQVPVTLDQVDVALGAAYDFKKKNGSAPALRLEDGTSPIRFSLLQINTLDPDLDDKASLSLTEAEAIALVTPTIQAADKVRADYPVISGTNPPQANPTRLVLKRAGIVNLGFSLASLGVNIPEKPISIISRFKTFRYSGNLADQNGVITMSLGSTIDVKLGLSDTEGGDDLLVATRSQAGDDGAAVVSNIPASTADTNGLTITARQVGEANITYDYKGPQFFPTQRNQTVLKIRVTSSVNTLAVTGSQSGKDFVALYSSSPAFDSTMERVLALELRGGGRTEPLTRAQYDFVKLAKVVVNGVDQGERIPTFLKINGRTNQVLGPITGPVRVVASDRNKQATLFFEYSGTDVEAPRPKIVEVDVTIQSNGSIITTCLESSGPLAGKFALRQYESIRGDNDVRAKPVTMMLAHSGQPLVPTGTFTVLSFPSQFLKRVTDSVTPDTVRAYPRFRGIKEGSGTIKLRYTGTDVPGGSQDIDIPFTVLSANSTIIIR